MTIDEMYGYLTVLRTQGKGHYDIAAWIPEHGGKVAKDLELPFDTDDNMEFVVFAIKE